MTIEQFLGVAVPVVTAVVGLIWYMQRREDKVWKKINEIEKEIGVVKADMAAKVQGIHDAMHEFKTEVLVAMHETEKGMRESFHGLREDLAKFFGKMEAKEGK